MNTGNLPPTDFCLANDHVLLSCCFKLSYSSVNKCHSFVIMIMMFPLHILLASPFVY
jgi:hypothetical protein